MLAPDQFTTETALTDVFNQYHRIGAYASSVQQTRVGPLVPDPNWLPAVRSRMGLLTDAAGAWQMDGPTAWADMLTPFATMAGQMKAVQNAAPQIPGADGWITVLSGIIAPAVSDALDKSTAAQDVLHSRIEAFQSVQPLLQDSIDTAWSALATEETQMVKIAEALVGLQMKVQALSNDMSSGMISGNQSYLKSTFTIGYDILSATGGGVPFLSIATTVFGITKLQYDTITDAIEIHEALKTIATLQMEARDTAQAAAATKAVLQMLYEVEKQFLQLQNAAPAIVAIWQEMHGTVQDTISALKSGSDPAKLPALTNFAAACRVWSKLSALTQAMSEIAPKALPAVDWDPASKAAPLSAVS